MTDRALDRLPSDVRVIATYCRGHTVQIERLTDVVRRYVARIAMDFKDVDTVDDLVQEAMVRALEQCPEHFMPREASFLSWAGKVAKNRFIDLRRRRRPEEGTIVVSAHGTRQDGPELPIADHRGERAEVWWSRLEEVLGASEPNWRRRAVFQMRFWDGKEWVEIADAFGLKPKTMQNWMPGTLERMHDYCKAHDIDFDDLREGLYGTSG